MAPNSLSCSLSLPLILFFSFFLFSLSAATPHWSPISPFRPHHTIPTSFSSPSFLSTLSSLFSEEKYEGVKRREGVAEGHFDPHNHFDGILPWQAYVNLSTFLHTPRSISFSEALALWQYINSTFFPSPLPPTLPLFNTDVRLGSGSYATLLLFQNISEFIEAPSILYGVLERLLTTTPFTEFDCEYNLRDVIGGTDIASYWMQNLFNLNSSRLSAAKCAATLSHLQSTNVTQSEQSVSFASLQWTQDSQCVLDCLSDVPSHPHKFLVMGLTNHFAYFSPTHYLSWSHADGECRPVPWSTVENVTVDLMKEADELTSAFVTYADGAPPNSCQTSLQGKDPADVLDVLVGLDHAGPELVCFTPEGMQYLRRITSNLRDEVWRRTDAGIGWNGRPLLNHLHVGEGFTIYYAKEPIQTDNMTFESVFGTLPGYPPSDNFLSNPAAASQNIDLVMTTIEEMIAEDMDLYGTVVFRLGHVSQMTPSLAERMSQLVAKYPGLIEADINIDSNLVTHAYMAPDSANLSDELSEILSNRKSNFVVNNFPYAVAPDPLNVTRVGEVYGNFTALKYLLLSGVPVMLPVILGTDASGTEHSLIDRQFALSSSLISYWSLIDPAFASLNVTTDYFMESADIHLKVMDGDMKAGKEEREWVIVLAVCGVFVGVGVGVAAVYVGVKRREKDGEYDLL